MNMLNWIRLLQPNRAGNIRNGRVHIVKSQIIAVFNIQKGVQNYWHPITAAF